MSFDITSVKFFLLLFPGLLGVKIQNGVTKGVGSKPSSPKPSNPSTSKK